MSVEITASLVKELRERTNAAMMDCKRALVESKGNIDDAIKNMREQGQIKAAKKAGRIAAEGTICVLSANDDKEAIILEVNSETDFVSREERFKAFAKQLGARALAARTSDVEAFLKLPMEAGGTKTIEEARLELVSQLGENIAIRRLAYQKAADGFVGVYGHGDANGVRIGVMVTLKNGTAALARDLSMHIAAMNPEFISADLVPASRLASEKEIYLVQTREKEAGKPEAMIEKIVENKLKKFVNELSLLTQPFVKEATQTVEQLLKGAGAQVMHFVRFEVGEGIEKAEDNFVQEVMAQARGE